MCPFYKSLQHDIVYDISDYQDVYEKYGTVEGVEASIQGRHDRGMRINHTTHLHAWFQVNASSKTNPKQDWYMWRLARYLNGERRPPCNWRCYDSRRTSAHSRSSSCFTLCICLSTSTPASFPDGLGLPRFGEKSKFYPRKWALAEFKETLQKWQSFIEGNDRWTTNFLEKHDTGRSVSRYGSDSPQFAAASGCLCFSLL
ncbi:alpha amylase [Lipomyces starkeyi]